ncbi:MAG: ATP-dependent Clp protease proteolytic subunit [Planctomycetota bacterium]
MHSRFVTLIAFVLLCLPSTALADTLILKTGERVEGRLISVDDRHVVFEVHDVGMRMVVRKSVDDVSEIREPDGPLYGHLKLYGAIGRVAEGPYVTAQGFVRAVQEFRNSGAEYVVLEIDSPGGSVPEMQQILNTIASSSDMQFVALVKNAHSAGAVIAMACTTIFMHPDASIGAAVPIRQTASGTPQNIEAKMLSPILASMRRAARTGGHSDLLMRGMSEYDLELSIDMTGNQPVVVEGSLPGNPLLKTPGSILTLTAFEAQMCGLATGQASSIEDVRTNLGLASWTAAREDLTHYLLQQARLEQNHQRVQAEAAERRARLAAQEEAKRIHRQQQDQQVRESLQQMESQRSELSITINQLAAKLSQQLASRDTEVAALTEEYRAMRVSASRSGAPGHELTRH